MAAELIDNDPTAVERTRQTVLDAVMGLYYMNRATYDNLQILTWNNPYGLTPQQVFDAYGNKAAALVAIVTSMVTLNTTISGKIKTPAAALVSLNPAGVTVVVNADGTVTLS